MPRNTSPGAAELRTSFVHGARQLVYVPGVVADDRAGPEELLQRADARDAEAREVLVGDVRVIREHVGPERLEEGDHLPRDLPEAEQPDPLAEQRG